MISGALYEGTVRHRRFAQRRHEFRHRVAMAYVDVDAAPRLLRLRRRDRLGNSAAVRTLVRARTGAAPDGPVRLLTFGPGFNPVRFFYCFDRGERLRAVVAEVTNTPWGERHAYVLDGDGPVLHGDVDKAMRVSPFMGMEQRYVWHVAAPGETLSVHIESRERGERAFDATLSLHRRPLRLRRLAGGTLRVTALIYAHAVALRIKGVRRP